MVSKAKFTLAFIILSAFVAREVKAQYVGISDSSLRYWLQQNYPNCMQGYMLDTTCADVRNATGQISPAVDSDITGLEYFTGIQTLQLSGINGTHAITRLRGYYPPNLTELDIIASTVRFIPDLLPAGLQHLDLSYNNIQQLPALPAGLRFLNITYNGRRLTPGPVLMSAWPGTLDTLIVDGNDFMNQSFPALPQGIHYFSSFFVFYGDSVPAFPSSLLHLDIKQCAITFSDSTFNWPPNLTYLDCTDNFFVNDTLPALPANLQTLNAYLCGLTKSPVYPPTLQLLDISENDISTFYDFPPGLLSLDCYGNPDSTLPTLPASLTSLSCGSSYFTTLPALPTRLTSLSCENSLITNLTPLPSSINYLELKDDILLTSLPPSLPDSLIILEVSGDTLLTCFPPLPMTMEYLEYTGTQITCLPNYPIIKYGSNPPVNRMPLCDINSSCPSLWNISGSIYYNNSNNCSHQSNEPLTQPIKMNLWQGGNLVQQIYAPGVYSFKTNYNNYTVKVDTTSNPFDFSCLSDSTVTINHTDSMQVVNFEAHCKPGYDLGVNYVCNFGKPFPGSTTLMQILAGDAIQNQYGVSCNTAGLSGQVQVTITGKGTYAGVGNGVPTPTSVNSNTVTWDVSDFSQGNGRYDVLVHTDTNATFGDEVCVDITITPRGGDNNLSNNILTQCFAVQNSFDPNYKEVSPVSELPYPYSDWLTYTVHFQNTGTAAARNITITDTLDANVDPASFQLLAYSYEPTVQISGRYVTFYFRQILLPDSAANPQGSMGYVQYRVKPLANLSIGATISNTAYIYFDFNTPVVTNSTINTVSPPAGVKNVTSEPSISIYPNPSTGNWQLVVDNSLVGSALQIFDEQGQIVFQSKISLLKSKIDLSVASGVYYLRINNENLSLVRKLVKM